MMKVKQLIKKLEKLDPELEVATLDYEYLVGMTVEPIKKVTIITKDGCNYMCPNSLGKKFVVLGR